jgi:hypothetical protein
MRVYPQRETRISVIRFRKTSYRYVHHPTKVRPAETKPSPSIKYATKALTIVVKTATGRRVLPINRAKLIHPSVPLFSISNNRRVSRASYLHRRPGNPMFPILVCGMQSRHRINASQRVAEQIARSGHKSFAIAEHLGANDENS